MNLRLWAGVALFLLAIPGERSRAQTVDAENIPGEILESTQTGQFAETYVD